MKRYLLSFILTLPMFITGCWDKVEIENRGFVIAMGIDKFEDKNDDKAVQLDDEKESQKARYTVTMALPDIGALSGPGGDDSSEFVKIAAAPTVSAAIRLIDTFSSERLYFGHTKAVIFHEDILKDEYLFREALDAIERNRELSRSLLVLATSDDIKKVLDADIPGEPLVGAFIAEFYRKSEGAAITFKQDLEGLTRRLRSGGDALIPIISLEGKKKDVQVKLGGTAVIKDFQMAGKLSDSQTRAFMWFNGKAKGALITAEHEGIDVPMRINSSKSKTSFYEENGRIICVLDINARAEVEEFDFLGIELNDDESLRELSEVCERIVSDEISQLFTTFRDELEVDGFGLHERLRKQNHVIFAAYGDEAYKHMMLIPRVDLKITGAGVIK